MSEDRRTKWSGNDGITATNTEATFTFTQAVEEVEVVNDGANDLYVGFVTDNQTGSTTDPTQRQTVRAGTSRTFKLSMKQIKYKTSAGNSAIQILGIW